MDFQRGQSKKEGQKEPGGARRSQEGQEELGGDRRNPKQRPGGSWVLKIARVPPGRTVGS